MPQELTIPIGASTDLQEILRAQTINGKVVKIELMEVVIKGIDAGQVGESWSLRMGNDWVTEELNVLKAVTNSSNLDTGTHNRSGARDISLFVGDSPVYRVEWNTPRVLINNQPINQQTQLIAPYFVLSSDGYTRPTWDSAWARLKLWTDRDPIITKDKEFLLKQWRN
jgi:hypothetical protein